MSTTLDLFAHAKGTVVAGVLTPDVQVACQLTRVAQGQYRVTVNAGQGAAAGDVKATINALGVAARTVNFQPVSQTVFDVFTADDAGALQDVTDLWVSLERVPRVQ
jgi:hypothetical protein